MKRILPLLVGLAMALSFATAGKAMDMTHEDIRQGYKAHAALAQFYRWFQYYERPQGGIENALDMLAQDVMVESGLGTAKGHEEYAARVSQLPDSWQNAHFVTVKDIAFSEDGSAVLTADVAYLNTGMLDDGAVRRADLAYSVSLTPGTPLLPLAASIVIAPKADGTEDLWRDAYPENRVKSLVHYYLAVIEDPGRDPEPMRELLETDFSLNFSSGAITDFDGFAAWLAGPASQVDASTHIMSNFSVGESNDALLTASFDFDWAGLLPDGTELVAKTRHTWTMTNDVKERFARIKSVNVEILEPFRPKGG